MRKTIFKTICVFTLVFFVMSMAGAASSNSCKTKTDAKDDKFTVNCKCVKCNCFNVLKNDKGCDLKVKSPIGCITTKLGGKVCMQSNGNFCYTKPKNCCSCTDSFKYCVIGKDGKTDCATVTLKINC